MSKVTSEETVSMSSIGGATHEIMTLWWYRIVPHRSYVKGWKIGPSHFLNQDLATVWLDK